MSPREVIARALLSHVNSKNDWDKLTPGYQAQYLKTADAVIDALEKMEVTEGMREAFWDGTGGTPADLWRAMVGAMKE